ncbi:hypothetical protein Tco_0767075 [Tanacetum coccineum]
MTLFDDINEPPVCSIQRFEMIKYSFGQGEEYVAIKEDEYDDLARTSNNACHTYQEIFRMMDEGWMDPVKIYVEYLVENLELEILNVLESFESHEGVQHTILLINAT